MKVYLVSLGTTYEGGSVQGVFGTREAALTKAAEIRREERAAVADSEWEIEGSAWIYRSSVVDVREWEVK